MDQPILYDPLMDAPSDYDPPEELVTVFNRYEKKYLMPEAVYFELRRRLKPYMQVDMYGLTQILNIYFDTPDNLLVRRSNEFPIYKEKLRLRSYGVPNMESLVFLEIKKKHEGLRVTFDHLIRGRRTEVGLENGAFGTMLIPDSYYLMETKILDVTPYWFTRILSELSLYMTTFSKYGNLFRQEQNAFDAEAYLRHRLDNWKKTGEKSYV